MGYVLQTFWCRFLCFIFINFFRFVRHCFGPIRRKARSNIRLLFVGGGGDSGKRECVLVEFIWLWIRLTSAAACRNFHNFNDFKALKQSLMSRNCRLCPSLSDFCLECNCTYICICQEFLSYFKL